MDILSIRPGLPVNSNKPSSLRSYRIALRAIKAMVDAGVMKNIKDPKGCPTKLRVLLENLVGRSRAYISKGDTYCALHDMGVKIKSDRGDDNYAWGMDMSSPPPKFRSYCGWDDISLKHLQYKSPNSSVAHKKYLAVIEEVNDEIELNKEIKND